MSTYIFILGKDPELSVAELKARYPDADRTFLQRASYVCFESERDIDQGQFDMLGGQIKVGRLVADCRKGELVPLLADILSAEHYSGKLNYGVSVYEWSEKNLRLLLLDLKKEFKRREVSSRFANQDFKNISVAQYKGLQGKEMLICKDGDNFLLAEVVAVQDIDAYSGRDFNKPFRSMKVGMLPPKLAQILINLTGAEGKIWDPFCGGGVLLMEGLLMGHEMFGSDIDDRALAGAQKNCDWVCQAADIKPAFTLLNHDATKPMSDTFDAIACEGYLGPPQERMRSRAELEPLIRELTDLYTRFFKALDSFRGPVVIALPFFRVREGELHLNEIVKSAEKLGFRKTLNLKYARPDQLVGRDIFRFSAV